VKRAARWVFILVLLLVLFAAAAYFVGLRALEARGVRARLSAELANLFEFQAAISWLRWDGRTISSSAVLTRDAPPIKIHASQVTMPLTIVDLWRNEWKIDKLSVADAQMTFGLFAAPASASPPTENFELREVDIAHTNILYGDTPQNATEVRDAHTRISRADGGLVIEADGGTLRYGNAALLLLNGRLIYAKPNLRIDRASFTVGDNSSIELTGNITFDQPHEVRAAGAVVIAHAILKNIALLQRVANLAGRAELAQPKIDNVQADYDWNAQTLTVRNFVGEAKSIAAVRGEFVVQNEKLNGEFELGVAPDIVDKFPGAREDVFKINRDGYVWTAVSVSGPVGDLRDNLRPRLLRAAQDHHAEEKAIEAIEEL
jgi:hypothetical protein